MPGALKDKMMNMTWVLSSTKYSKFNVYCSQAFEGMPAKQYMYLFSALLHNHYIYASLEGDD